MTLYKIIPVQVFDHLQILNITATHLATFMITILYTFLLEHFL